MNIMFYAPLFYYEVADWERKKSEFISKIDKCSNFEYYELNEFQTDRHNKKNDYTADFENIFYDELKEFLLDARLKALKVKDIWTVKYTKENENHCPHNHSSTGYTGILYLEYDPEVHESTKFIVPWNNPVTDKTQILGLPDPKPGVIYIWPSFILHYAENTKTNKMRMLTSWDMEVI